MPSLMLQGKKSLRIFMLATVLVVNLFIIALLAYALSETRREYQEDTRKTIENMALLLDQSVSTASGKIDHSLREIADELEKELKSNGRLDSREVNDLLQVRQAWISQLGYFRVTDAAGSVKYGTGILPGSTASFVDRDYFVVHRNSNKVGMNVTNLIQGRLTNTWLIAFARRYNYPDGRFAGVVTAAIPASYFAQMLSAVNLGPHGIAVLRDADTAQIARYPAVENKNQQIGTMTFSKELAAIIASGVTTSTYHSKATGDGVERINAYRRLSALPFHLVTGMAAEDYLADWRNTVWQAAGVATIFLVFSAIMAWLLWRSFISTEMASERSRMLLQQASDGIHILDGKGRLIEASDSFCRMLGYTRAEVIGMHIQQWDANLPLNAIEQDIARQFERHETLTFETTHRRKDGSAFEAEITSCPLVLDGQPMIYASARDITQRKRTDHELREALAAARTADHAKDEFLANITHELRTPLSAVIGFSSLARPFCTDARQSEYLDKVNSAGKTLASLINDLLDLSKIVAGHMEFEATPFSLRQLVARSRSVISYQAKEKALELVELIDDAIPDVLVGDRLRVEQILLNLLSNAVKFTAVGRVELRFGLNAREAQRVCLLIEVEDTGIGMRADEIALLFKPFAQVDASMTRKFGGSGLGLAICKRLAQMMDGDISVTSREGSGSTFRVRLWLGLAEAGELPPVEEKEPAAEQVRYHDVRVLVVDDQPFNRDVVQGLLAVVGITPHLAENGQEAFDILQDSAETFDLVLMDIQMPVMDGLTATRTIRGQARYAELPIIAMTAHTMTHEKVKAVDAGMNDHIGKPFDEAGFYRVLRRWISRSKQRLNSNASASMAFGGSGGMPLLPGVDTQAGMSLLQGDEVRYRHWLSDFVVQAPVALAEIRRSLAAGEPASASMAVHTLKGRMGLLGMKGLHGIAAALETAIDGAAPTDQLLLGLTPGVVAMCAEIQSVLGVSQNPVTTDEPMLESLQPDLPPVCIVRLIASLQAGDSDCDQLITDCLADLKGTVWVLRLRQALIHAKNFDYAAALNLLSDTRQDSAKEG